MRTLVLADDHWHPAHIARAGLAALGNCGFEFDWIENAAAWSAEKMAGYPLVLFTKSNNVSAADQTPWASDAMQQAFADYVHWGNGLLVVHSGAAGYQRTPVLRALMGGVFLQHPPQCPVTVEPHPDHPLTTGSTPYTLTDEHYFMALDDPQADVFMTTRSEHGTQPGGWTRTEGAGRVCMLTPSHTVEGWTHPPFQALLLNALRWCGKQSN
jgi:type 1 glutamine amidotransferase